MNSDLPDEALAFEAAARHAFADLGGVAFARRAEADPSLRSEAAAALGALGSDDLDPRDGAAPAGAAAVLCRAAGAAILPYPVEATLLGDPATGRPFAVVADPPMGAGPDVAPQDSTLCREASAHDDAERSNPRSSRPEQRARRRVDHGDLAPTWDVATLGGVTGSASAFSTDGVRPLGTELGPFCCDLTLDVPLASPDDAPAPDTAEARASGDAIRRSWWLALTSWRILGALEQAVTLAARHTSEREQFDKPLTAFQTVRFALADASVATTGLGELARFTLWRLTTDPDRAYGDALALRCHAVDVAREVLRATQHLHGATGLCDEADIAILVRHLQPALRLPESGDATARRLAEVVDRDGFEGLFPHRRREVGGSGDRPRRGPKVETARLPAAGANPDPNGTAA